ncbi:MAG: hypothetical protein J1F61_05350 [Clostridiales bacterium]|nr:hypothetical protein [Clostridiales bacterium]
MNRVEYPVHFFSENQIKNIFNQRREAPVIIEILGTPNSGKTTSLNKFEVILRRFNINNYKILYEAGNGCPIKDKFSPRYNFWTACETIKNVLESIDSGIEVIVCERGIYDAICWALIYFEEKMIDLNQFKALLNFYSLDIWQNLFKYLLIVKCEVNEAIEREKSNGLIEKEGKIVNNIVLSKYNKALKCLIKKYLKGDENYSIIDTTAQQYNDTIKTIVSNIFSFLESSK